MAIWEKFNPREKLSAIGAGLIILGFLVSLASYGAGVGSIALIGAIAVLAVLYLNHAPNQSIAWPAPTSLIILGISAVVALLVLVDLLRVLGYLGLFGATAILAVRARRCGCGRHALGRLAGIPGRQAGDAEPGWDGDDPRAARRPVVHPAAGRADGAPGRIGQPASRLTDGTALIENRAGPTARFVVSGRRPASA